MSGTGPFTEECVEAARRPWTPRRGPRASSRVRLFRSFVPEHLIFAGHPALPFLLVTPAVGWLLEAAPRNAWAPALVALGALSWTLVEYAMHRWLFHFPSRRDPGKVTTFIVHGHHHVSPREPSRLAATPVQIGSLALLMLGVFQLTLGAGWRMAMVGFLAAYLAYEAVHHIAHHGRPRSRLLRAIRRHHLSHHYEHEGRAAWGISSPLWDWVFGTVRPRADAPRPERAAAPPR